MGCGKLGQKIGESLSELSIEVIGIKRNPLKSPPRFKIITLDIFSDKFSDNVKSINPDFLIYAVSSDEQTQESYHKNYVEGLKVTINALKKLNNFQHLFFISSTRVYGQFSDDYLSELTPPKPSDFGGKLLLDAEKSLKNISFKTTILRLSGIYGNNRRHMLRLAADPSKWPAENRWTNRIHEEDIVSFINYLFSQILADMKIEDLYLLTDSQPILLFELLRWIRSDLNLPKDNIITPKGTIGKKLKSELLEKLNFSFTHSNYRSGYHKMITSMKEVN